jgi:hypothetical protein
MDTKHRTVGRKIGALVVLLLAVLLRAGFEPIVVARQSRTFLKN